MAAWGLIKPILKEALGCRTLALAALAAVGGGIVVSALAYWLCGHAVTGIRYARPIKLSVAALYAVAGAYVAALWSVLSAAARAVEIWRPSIHDAVANCVAVGIRDLPPSSAGIEIAQIDAICDQAFDSAVVRWRIRRHVEPIVAPLRESGQTHVMPDVLQKYASAAVTDALIGYLRGLIVKPRLAISFQLLALLMLPILGSILRAILT